jgi:hypothetical protein
MHKHVLDLAGGLKHLRPMDLEQTGNIFSEYFFGI